MQLDNRQSQERLTWAAAAITMAHMERETLIKVLGRAQGVEQDGDTFRRREDHELTVYLGTPGRAMVVSHVLSLSLLDSHVEIEARDRGTLYTDYDAVHALLSKQADEVRDRGSVGFGR